jgi:glycerate dehydrogenase
VLTTEPPDPANPLLRVRLPNFILTPHVAWASKQAMQALADQLVDNIEAFAAGRQRCRTGSLSCPDCRVAPAVLQL